ncbi:MAG: type II restriction endonuclease [Endomicrobiaceae bacterium]|nr:type II restriction endonuclease [Endomicrobiaceae bacterium]
MKRNFNEWISKFSKSIANYEYYVDFNKVIKNTEKLKIELNILNSLIGSKNIEKDFENIIKKYPQTLKCIPVLLAVRTFEINAIDIDGAFIYNFKESNYSIEQYKIFMRKTGLFDLLANHLINNLVDYVYGIETGLDSNGRKNRGGHLMENLVESYLKKVKVKYYKEMYLKEIEQKWGLDLSPLSNNGKSKKRFDFVVETKNIIYAVETNFYSGGGSKLNETARSYKMLALESQKIKGFAFVWFTDGSAWKTARRNLEETFDAMEHIYSIDDMKNGIMDKLFK